MSINMQVVSDLAAVVAITEDLTSDEIETYGIRVGRLAAAMTSQIPTDRPPVSAVDALEFLLQKYNV